MTTEKLGLEIEVGEEFFNVEVFNSNFQKIDNFAKTVNELTFDTLQLALNNPNMPLETVVTTLGEVSKNDGKGRKYIIKSSADNSNIIYTSGKWFNKFISATETERGNYNGTIEEINKKLNTLIATGTIEPIEADLEETTNKGVANGYAPLNSSAMIPSEFLPSYVDDIVEGFYHNLQFYKEIGHLNLIVPELSKIYVDITNDGTNQYRWSGSSYIFTGTGQLSTETTNGLMSFEDKKQINKVLKFDTISDTQAYTGFVAGDIIETLGYAIKGDGKGNTYILKSTNDGTNIQIGSLFLNYVDTIENKKIENIKQNENLIISNKCYGSLFFDASYIGTIDFMTELEALGIISGTAYFKNWSDITLPSFETAVVEKPFKIIEKYKSGNEIVSHSPYPLDTLSAKFVKEDCEDEFNKMLDFGIYQSVISPYSSKFDSKQDSIYESFGAIARTVILCADGSNWEGITLGENSDLNAGFPRIAMEYFYTDYTGTAQLPEAQMLQVMKNFIDWCKTNNRSFVFGGHVTNFSTTIKQTIKDGFTYAKNKPIQIVNLSTLFSNISSVFQNMTYAKTMKKITERLSVVNENLLPSSNLSKFATVGGSPTRSNVSNDLEDYCILSGNNLSNFRIEYDFFLKRDTYIPYPLTFAVDYLKNNSIIETFTKKVELFFLDINNQIVDSQYSKKFYEPFAVTEKGIRTMYITSEVPVGAVRCYVNVGFEVANGTFNLGETRIYNPRLNRGAYPSAFIKKIDNVENLEQFTGNYFLGKKVYKKVVSCGALPNTTTKNIPHGISSYTNAWFSKECFAKDGTNGIIPLPYFHSTTANGVRLEMNTSNIIIACGANFSSFSTTYVTIEYTKD